MLFTPPIMTVAASIVVSTPVVTVGMPYVSYPIVDMAFDCTDAPIPKVAIAVKRAKAMAIIRQKRLIVLLRALPPRPYSRAYIGPPSIFPS